MSEATERAGSGVTSPEPTRWRETEWRRRFAALTLAWLRRKGNRRAHDLGVSIDGYEGCEHRQKVKRGRRQTDGRGG